MKNKVVIEVVIELETVGMVETIDLARSLEAYARRAILNDGRPPTTMEVDLATSLRRAQAEIIGIHFAKSE